MTAKTAAKRILLVEDEERHLESLARLLEKGGLEVVTAANGKRAQELTTLSEYDAVVSGFRLPGSVTGLDLFQHVRRASKNPFILMTPAGPAGDPDRQAARKAGVDGVLTKPFHVEDLRQLLEKAWGPGATPDRAAAELDDDYKYSRIAIDDFVTGLKIQYNIFIRFSKAKYLKIANQGEDLAVDRIHAYKEKGIRHLYLLKADFTKYLRFALSLAPAVQASPGLSADKKRHFVKHTQDILLEKLHSESMNPELFEDAKSMVESSVSFLTEAPDTFDLLHELNSYSEPLYAHSLGVSLYGVLIARQVGWNSTQNLYKVALGGLLHDIGKRGLPPALLAKPRHALTAADVKLLESHSDRGMTMLSRVPTIHTDVVEIVLRHHERDDGTGYPDGLKKKDLNPLSRVVNVANEFCNLVICGPGERALPPLEAIHRMVDLYSATIEPQYMHALAKVFHVPTPVKA